MVWPTLLQKVCIGHDFNEIRPHRQRVPEFLADNALDNETVLDERQTQFAVAPEPTSVLKMRRNLSAGNDENLAN
jgi:hypothetical protein